MSKVAKIFNDADPNCPRSQAFPGPKRWPPNKELWFCHDRKGNFICRVFALDEAAAWKVLGGKPVIVDNPEQEVSNGLPAANRIGG